MVIGLPNFIYFHCFNVLNKVVVRQIEVIYKIPNSCVFQKELDRTQRDLALAIVQHLPPHCAPLAVQISREYSSRQGVVLMNAPQ